MTARAARASAADGDRRERRRAARSWTKRRWPTCWSAGGCAARYSTCSGRSHWRPRAGSGSFGTALVVPHVSPVSPGRFWPRQLDLFLDNWRRYVAGEPLAQPRRQAGRILNSWNKIIKAAVDRGASDLHIKAGDVFRARIHGKLVPLTKQALTPEQTRTIALHLMRNEDDKARIDKLTDYDCSWSAAGIGRFRVNILRQRSSFMIVMRVIPFEMPTFEKLRLPPVLAQVARGGARHGARDRRDRLGQVEHDGGDGELHQPAREPAHPHAREPDRVPAHATSRARSRSARSAVDTTDFKMGLRAALRQDPDVDHDRRDARRRDGRHGDQGRRDGPPAHLHAAHARRAEHDPPHHGDVPARGAGGGAHPTQRVAAMRWCRSACCRAPTARAAPWRRRSSSSRRRCAT